MSAQLLKTAQILSQSPAISLHFARLSTGRDFSKVLDMINQHVSLQEASPLLVGLKGTKDEFISALKAKQSKIINDQKTIIVKNQDGEVIATSISEDYFSDEFHENDTADFSENIREILLAQGLIRQQLYDEEALPANRGTALHHTFTVVSPEYRNQGVFNKMVELQEQIAVEQGYQYLISNSTSQVVTDKRINAGFSLLKNIPFSHVKIPFSSKKLDLEHMYAEFIDVESIGFQVLIKDLKNRS